MIFRNATIHDLPLITDIYNSTIESRMVTADTEPVTVLEKQEWFLKHNEHTRPLWMIEDEEKNCIGWASYQSFYGRPAYNGTAELSIYIHESMRGKGYGKKILKHCIENAHALGIDTLLGFIFAHNEPSMKLFTAAGFEEWAYLPEVALIDGKKYSLKILGRKISEN